MNCAGIKLGKGRKDWADSIGNYLCSGKLKKLDPDSNYVAQHLKGHVFQRFFGGIVIGVPG
ncbi:MAG: hypothetical protein CMH77_02755 [Nitrospinae bacterium]|nr:hypothetical protein [Nitrospinota bacterium]